MTQESTSESFSGYQYDDAELNQAHAFLLPRVEQILESLKLSANERIFDLGCGSGATAQHLHNKGYDVLGVDPSAQAIIEANKAYPHLKLSAGNAYDDLAARYGQFKVVLSLEVVEHVFYPRKYATTIFNLLEPGGTAIISTPYHGYWKNLAVALAGKMDDHYKALWDYGHIKFWSMKTMSVLLEQMGFVDIAYHRVGRIPALACSMIAVARKPELKLGSGS